ncbi:tetratricopeptide repeat protein [Singulisphaera acidiphila]|uniref:Thioredoxin domain-containing protein n=1 Tax=Singulisphaera acidiphila (strain ATCC BAA-1392 / DSM 18658 / VKM B-2454 / MOB10) TaxID=886293 RepID=L0D9Y2_SINAD|nr:tetratricopeptide repeat protein [Singulisphaera acidiphila]AGA25436.1 thioredoxin domain-containing protein [Singulisphaera acidiphila DSM 18658]
MSTNTPYVIDTTSETFEKDVIERSSELPVVIDFWAEWCAPCRTLGPILERLAEEYDGKFLLVKANTEEVAQLASAFGVRSIPAVFGLVDGRVRDSFVGVLSESAIRAFLDRLMPTPAETAIKEAKGLEATDSQAAEAKYRSALELLPNEPAIKIGLARTLLAQDRLEEGRALITDLERRGFLEPEAEKVKAELTLRGQGQATGGVEAARAAVEASPNDLPLKLALAEALAAAGQYEAALDLCLELVERDRKGVGESARKTMLAIFRLLGDAEIVGDYQRKLATVLF